MASTDTENVSETSRETTNKLGVALLWVQGVFYFLTGIWPLVSIETFQLVTGPKTDHRVTGREADHWLVMTAGVLITAIGTSLLVAAWRRRVSAEIVTLAIGAAIGLTTIDVVYVSRQVIAPIYLADAVAEVGLIVMWGFTIASRESHDSVQR